MMVRLATASDAEAVAAVLSEAARWLERTAKWNDWPLRYPVGRLMPFIQRNELYVAWSTVDDSAMGTFVLQWSDERFWGIRPPDAGYLHRVAVAPRFSGHGIGEAMIRWAAGEVTRRGRRFLRLDCPAANQALQAYYERLGFVRRGEAQGRNGYRGIRYESTTQGLFAAGPIEVEAAVDS